MYGKQTFSPISETKENDGCITVTGNSFYHYGFWALGGGSGTGNENQLNKVAGLNLQLPDANLKMKRMKTNISFYQEADADSLKRAELLRNDPYYKDTHRESQFNGCYRKIYTTRTDSKRGLNTSSYKTVADINEQKIYQKINEINKQINQPDITTTLNNDPDNHGNDNNEQFSKDVDRMQEMMQMMNDKEEIDPEMQQLNGTLEKILDIQHPQRVKDKLKEKSLQQKDVVFSVSKTPIKDNISLLDTSKHKTGTITGFYSANNNLDISEDNAVEAVVHANQTLVNGSVLKLRLTTDIYISGTLIPKGNFVYGVTSLNDERLEMEISSIRYGNSLFPVKLEVYDMDGLPGIHIPGAITREVAKQSADNSLQLMELTSVDPSLKAQAAAAGISTAKNLLSRKVKQVKVMVKSEYKVLLKSKNLQ